MKYPFEADLPEILSNPDDFVEAVFSSLESEFLLLPKGPGFIDYPTFEAAYEALKKVTVNFSQLPRDQIMDLASSTPLCILIIRSILGFTPPEWAYVAEQRTGVPVPQNFARSLERRARMEPLRPIKRAELKGARLKAPDRSRVYPHGRRLSSSKRRHNPPPAESRYYRRAQYHQILVSHGCPIRHAALRALPWAPLRRSPRLRKRTGRRQPRVGHRGCPDESRDQLSKDQAR